MQSLCQWDERRLIVPLWDKALLWSDGNPSRGIRCQMSSIEADESGRQYLIFGIADYLNVLNLVDKSRRLEMNSSFRTLYSFLLRDSCRGLSRLFEHKWPGKDAAMLRLYYSNGYSSLGVAMELELPIFEGKGNNKKGQSARDWPFERAWFLKVELCTELHQAR